MTEQEMFAALAAPFPPEKVSWRVGSVKRDGSAAMALAYIDARDVMDRLDEVCGPANWQDRYPHVDKKTVCEIDIYVEGRGWVTKSDGAGDSDIEAEKGALSDAFKRAAVRWGIGRYLYHLPSPWVQIDQYKKILPAEMGKLQALLGREARANAPPPPPKDPVDRRPLYVACKAAIDLAADAPALQAWAKDNEASMAKIKADDEEIYHAVRAYWAQRLGELRSQKAAA